MTEATVTSPSVGVVILNWNRCALTCECLNSVLALDYPGYEVVVVDNGSTDNSADVIAAHYPTVGLVRNPTNLGFAAGMNVGIRQALAAGHDYVLLLNNDVLVDSNLLRVLVKTAEEDRSVGLVVPKIVYYDEPTRVWTIGARRRRFPPSVVIIGYQQPDGPAFAHPRWLDAATGCVLLVRSAVFREVGLFDEEFFMYHEDLDLSLRARAAGYRIRYMPEARARHHESASTSVQSPLRWYYMARYSEPLYRKHIRWPRLSLLVYAGWVTIREIIKGQPQVLPPFWHGLVDGLRGSRTLPASRAGEQASL